ncbi:MAG: 16S rRNA (cytosine(1402)-N(4))-methyltransferase, partial [Candidatus Poribacteria bacterium]
MNFEHIPVMLHKVVDYLLVSKGGIYLDLTLGLGGHAEEILKLDPDVQLIGIDIDSEALSIAKDRLKKYGDRVKIVCGNFADLDLILSENGISKVDKI